MFDYAEVEMARIIYNHLKIGIQISDKGIGEIAESFYDSASADFENKKSTFIRNIHLCLGY